MAVCCSKDYELKHWPIGRSAEFEEKETEGIMGDEKKIGRGVGKEAGVDGADGLRDLRWPVPTFVPTCMPINTVQSF